MEDDKAGDESSDSLNSFDHTGRDCSLRFREIVTSGGQS